MKGKSERNKFLAPLAWPATQVPWERGGRGRGAACPACRGGSRCRRPPQSVPRGCARAARARARRAPSAPLPSGRGPARSAAQLRVSAGGVRGGGWAAAVRGLPSANSRLHGRYRLPSRGHRCPEPPSVPARLSALVAGPAPLSEVEKVCAAWSGARRSGANLG